MSTSRNCSISRLEPTKRVKWLDLLPISKGLLVGDLRTTVSVLFCTYLQLLRLSEVRTDGGSWNEASLIEKRAPATFCPLLRTYHSSNS